MLKPRKLPQRQCLGCREMKNKKDLIRAVRSPEGEITLDFKGKKPGRGRTSVPRRSACGKRGKAGPWSGPFPRPSPLRSMNNWRNK